MILAKRPHRQEPPTQLLRKRPIRLVRPARWVEVHKDGAGLAVRAVAQEGVVRREEHLVPHGAVFQAATAGERVLLIDGDGLGRRRRVLGQL